jgi:hypothetical protein
MLKGRLATYPGDVKLVVHEPIDTTGMAEADPREFAERVRRIIAPIAESDVDAAPTSRAPSNAVEAFRRA